MATHVWLRSYSSIWFFQTEQYISADIHFVYTISACLSACSIFNIISQKRRCGTSYCNYYYNFLSWTKCKQHTQSSSYKMDNKDYRNVINTMCRETRNFPAIILLRYITNNVQKWRMNLDIVQGRVEHIPYISGGVNFSWGIKRQSN